MEQVVEEEKIAAIPRLRFSGFSKDWRKSELGAHTDVSKLAGYEFTKHIVYADDGRIIAIRGLNVKHGQLDLSNVKYIDDSDFSKLERSRLHIDDMLFTYIGTIGDVALIEEEDRFYLAPNVARLRFDTEVLFPRFMLRLFEVPTFQNREVQRHVATSSQPALSMTNIRKFVIHLPTLPEQQKIAAFLGAVDRKIQQLKRKQELLEQYKKGVVQQLFSQQLRFKRQDGGEFPEWEEKRLGDVGETYNGLTGKAGADFGEGVPFITYKQIFASSKIDLALCEYVRIEPGENQTRAEKGDAFFTTSSETREEVGFASVLLDDVDDMYLNSFSFGYRIHSHKILSPDFARFLFRSEGFREDMIKLGQGSTRYNISKTGFREITVQLPSHEEQSRIAGFLMSLDAKVAGVAQAVAAAQRWKKGLLQQMFV